MKLKKFLLPIFCVVIIGSCIVLCVLFFGTNSSKDTVRFIVSGSDFSIQNREGKKTTYSSGQFVGEIDILSEKTIDRDSVTFEVPYSKEFTYSGDQQRVQISIESGSWAQSIDGSGIDRIVLNRDSDFVLHGESMTFQTSLNYPAGSRYSPFRLYAAGENQVSIRRTESGISIDGITDDVPVRVSYSSTGEGDIYFSEVELGYFTGEIEIDLSEMKSHSQIVVKTQTGPIQIVKID